MFTLRFENACMVILKQYYLHISCLRIISTKKGYKQSNIIPGLWAYKWRPIQLTLVVDNFGAKWVGKEHILHLISAMCNGY